MKPNILRAVQSVHCFEPIALEGNWKYHQGMNRYISKLKWKSYLSRSAAD